MKYLYHYILFITIVLIFAYINSMDSKEAFTTYIKQMYRPYVRHARVYSEGFYKKHKNNMENLFRKFGIM